MNKGLLKSHLNRAIAKGDTEKIAKYEAELEKFEEVPTIKPVDDSIITARERLNNIFKMKDTLLAFIDYNGNSYNYDQIGKLDKIDLDKTKFYQRKRNGFTQQIFFN
ncbi:hypothetical protein [Emticicia sp. W12TSBA100-4]|uniref:hypothetical protein n=1 Tax=Emticicia sp. W12TSBA100-4 TaxID=3160965 RepID=UPI003305DFB2